MKKKGTWNKGFDFKFKKLGNLMVEEGLITNDQLQNALHFQKNETEGKKLIGQVISQLYDIPLTTIESLCARKQIQSSLYKVFKASLEDDTLLKLRLKKSGSTFEDHVVSIDSRIDKWVISRLFHYNDIGEEILDSQTTEKVKAWVIFEITLSIGEKLNFITSFLYYLETGEIETDLPEVIGLVRLDLIRKIFHDEIKASVPVKVDFSDIRDLFNT